jgi:hypothetical protein
MRKQREKMIFGHLQCRLKMEKILWQRLFWSFDFGYDAVN